MTKEKVTYRCTAGLERTFDMHPDEIFETIEDFAGFDSRNPDLCFSPECKECKTARLGIGFGDDECGHLIRMCTLTKVK